MFRYAFFQYSEVGDFFMPLIICTITDPGQLSLPPLGVWRIWPLPPQVGEKRAKDFPALKKRWRTCPLHAQ